MTCNAAVDEVAQPLEVIARAFLVGHSHTGSFAPRTLYRKTME